MKKLTRASLAELAKTKNMISFRDQQRYVGGGIGTQEDPFTYTEFMNSFQGKNWNGGWVQGIANTNHILSYCGGTVDPIYVSQNVGYKGGTGPQFEVMYDGGTSGNWKPDERVEEKLDPNDCVWQCIAYIKYGKDAIGNDKLAHDVAKEILGDNFKEGNYACEMSIKDMGKMITDYFATHERKTTGTIQILVSEASDFYDDKGVRYDTDMHHAAIINSSDNNRFNVIDTQDGVERHANRSEMETRAGIITIR